jgi:hypothetical protein
MPEIGVKGGQGLLKRCAHHEHNRAKERKEDETMTKSLELIAETVHCSKLAFRKTDRQPRKPLKHRYERRKVREYLHLADWLTGETV